MKIHIFELRKKEWISEWSSQFWYTQLQRLRKESLKKKNWAWTGFEPLTSAIPVLYQLSYQANWSWSLCEFVIYPLRWWDESEYMKIHKFELRKKEWINECSSQLYTQLKQLRKESLRGSFFHLIFHPQFKCMFHVFIIFNKLAFNSEGSIYNLTYYIENWDKELLNNESTTSCFNVLNDKVFSVQWVYRSWDI